MNKDSAKKIGVIILLILQISMLTTGVISALALDGAVNDSDWSFWFADDGTPKFSTYSFDDESKVYLGIITESSMPASAQLEFAFKGAEYDWIIMFSDVSGIHYKRSKTFPGLGEDYWGVTHLGLPEGVEAIRGVTGSKYSYEISISKELLGVRGEDYPNKFKLWLMYTVDGKGNWIWTGLDLNGEANFYPDAYTDWWFSYDPSEGPRVLSEELVPTFHVPEIPLGTLMALATMLLVVYLKKKDLPRL